MPSVIFVLFLTGSFNLIIVLIIFVEAEDYKLEILEV